MNDKPLISIAIPTYNRAVILEKLLNQLISKIKGLNGLVEVCISNNASSDNTRDVITSCREQYPNLIKYNENKENTGADRNIMTVMKMSQGEFIWLFGDDDIIINNGVQKVIDFINNYCNKK